MPPNLTDIDQLALKIWTPSARPYVDEAVACYRISATRASIIAIWVAVCVDITEKIRWLAISGDAEAQTITTTLENIIAMTSLPQKLAKMLEFERGLLDLAENKFEFVSHNEARQLERLREDRGACAHPTFSDDGRQFTPIPELARLHIAQACDALLVHPPTQGKAILESLKKLVLEPSFPDDPQQAHLILSSAGHLSNAKETAVRNFAIAILKRVFKSDETLPMTEGTLFFFF